MNGLNPTSLTENHLFPLWSCLCKIWRTAGSVLGPFLLLIYINDLNHAIKFCKVHHFADDTNLVNFSKSASKLNKYINMNMKNLTNSLNSNKISPNMTKLSW